MSIKNYFVAAVIYTFAVHIALIIYGYLIIYYGEKVSHLRFVFIGIIGFGGIYSLSVFHKLTKAPISKREGVLWVLSCSTLFTLFTYGVSFFLDSASYLAFTLFGCLISLLMLPAIFYFIAPKFSTTPK